MSSGSPGFRSPSLARWAQLACLAALCGWGATGCAHHEKPKSYNRNISDDAQDPTFRADPQHAGDTIKFVQ